MVGIHAIFTKIVAENDRKKVGFAAAANAGDDLDQAIVHLVLQGFKINGALDFHSSKLVEKSSKFEL